MTAITECSDDGIAPNAPLIKPLPLRQQWADVAKGVSILLVILTHTVNGLEPPAILPPDTAWVFWNNWLYTFHVPIFFFIAGLFTEASYEKHGCRSFITSRITALGYPYVVWQTVQILLMLCAGGATNAKPRLISLLMFPVFPFMQFWFIYALMLVLISYALLKRAGASRHLIFAISVGMLFLPPMGWQQFSQEKAPLAWQPYNDLCCHMVYFGLGLLLPAAMRRLCDARWWLVLPPAIACGLGISLAVRFGINQSSALRPLPAVLGIAGISLISILVAHTAPGQWFSYLGRRSLELYVAHLVFAAGMRIALIRVFHVHDLTMHISLGLLAGILGPLSLLWLERSIPRLRFSLFRLR